MNNRQFIFCLATAFTLVVVGSVSAAHNPQHWVLYAVAGLLIILSFLSRKGMRSKLWRGDQPADARQS
ncbi:MAG: hypothetical protein OQJ89_06110 [Kangiellaceae bacterium]|nr:hypothetical protein [Kangiellaceae bacterium]MCW9016515.1 hypothetical protein [Kangiellaceae bacterium]